MIVSDAKAERMPPAFLDSRVWLLWLVGALAPALVTLNPWYQSLSISIVLLIWVSLPVQGESLTLRLMLRIAAFSLIFNILFQLLMVHYGETVLFRLPDVIPLIGGPATLQAAVYGLLNGLRLVNVLLIFALFSRAIRYAELLRLAPPAFFELGLIMSIGFTLVPFTLRAFKEIREAQALRGYEAKGLRDLLPLISPLIVSGMEHALTLAESMEARGYGAVNTQNRGRMAVGQGLAMFSLVIVLCALAVQVFFATPALVTGILMILAALLLTLGVGQLSAASGRTRFPRESRVWTMTDTLICVGALLPILMVIVGDPASLGYDPYLASQMPAFNPWIAMPLLGLALPALFHADR
jgi:energy-coupling factor transport system permease protein